MYNIQFSWQNFLSIAVDAFFEWRKKTFAFHYLDLSLVFALFRSFSNYIYIWISFSCFVFILLWIFFLFYALPHKIHHHWIKQRHNQPTLLLIITIKENNVRCTVYNKCNHFYHKIHLTFNRCHWRQSIISCIQNEQQQQIRSVKMRKIRVWFEWSEIVV